MQYYLYFFHISLTHKTKKTAFRLSSLTYLQNQIQEIFSTSLSYLSKPSYGHALDRLVAVSSIHYCTSTSALSTSSSSRGLSTFVGISHLEGGFTLRFLQRLSRPGLATLPWLWSANRYTSGQSIPVLSY